MANPQVFQNLCYPNMIEISNEVWEFVESPYQYSVNDPFFSTYNPGWASYTNIAWNQENHSGTQNFTPSLTQHFPRENTVPFNSHPQF